jgi:hypothetical protein
MYLDPIHSTILPLALTLLLLVSVFLIFIISQQFSSNSTKQLSFYHDSYFMIWRVEHGKINASNLSIVTKVMQSYIWLLDLKH